MTEPEIIDGYSRPTGARDDWATVCRWEDAGRPDIDERGNWSAPIDQPQLDEAEGRP